MALDIIKKTEVKVPKRLYNVNEAAVYLGRTCIAVREMIYKGKLPCIRDGRRVFLDVKDLDTWIDRSRTRYAD